MRKHTRKIQQENELNHETNELRLIVENDANYYWPLEDVLKMPNGIIKEIQLQNLLKTAKEYESMDGFDKRKIKINALVKFYLDEVMR